MEQQAWFIGRVLSDGLKQTYCNDDGTLKQFASESDANTFIANELQGAGDVFVFGVDTAKIIPIAGIGNA